MTSGIRSFTTSPYVFCSYQNARNYTKFTDGQSTYVLVRPAPGIAPETLRQAILARVPDVDVFTREEFAAKTQHYWMFTTGAGMRLLSLAGLARQILHWRDRSRICPACGGNPLGIAGTYGVRCQACGREYFPRIHPAIIVLVHRDDEFLLVRKAYWPKGQYGLVAGYVEFAESLEECVIREVHEETGIVVAEPRYLCSQNWPYPSQLMRMDISGA